MAKGQAQRSENPVTPPPAGLPETSDYHSLLVDLRDPERLLLGTHAGVYESGDGGRKWSFAHLEAQDAMNLVHGAGETVWAAGHDVLAKSEDGGKTWVDVRPEGLPGLDVHGFASDPKRPSRLYAAIAGEGLYRSDDGGSTFELVSKKVGPNVRGLAVTADGRIFAGDAKGLMVSADDGATWRRALDELVRAIAVSPGDPRRLLATGGGIFLSTDGGTTWEQVRALDKGLEPVAWAPSDASVAYAVGYDRKLYRSTDAGASWRAVA